MAVGSDTRGEGGVCGNEGGVARGTRRGRAEYGGAGEGG